MQAQSESNQSQRIVLPMRLSAISNACMAGREYAQILANASSTLHISLDALTRAQNVDFASAANGLKTSLHALTRAQTVDFASAVAALNFCTVFVIRYPTRLISRSTRAWLLRELRELCELRELRESDAPNSNKFENEEGRPSTTVRDEATVHAETTVHDAAAVHAETTVHDEAETTSETTPETKQAEAAAETKAKLETLCVELEPRTKAKATKEDATFQTAEAATAETQTKAEADALQRQDAWDEVNELHQPIAGFIAAALHIVEVCTATCVHVFRHSHLDAFASVMHLNLRLQSAVTRARDRVINLLGEPTTNVMNAATTFSLSHDIHDALVEAKNVFEVLAMPIR